MGQPVSRLFAMLGTYFPAILRRQHHARRGGGRAAHGGGGASEYSGDELSSTIGKGCGSTNVGTPFFGNFFLMGGELYDTAKPEVFLFGDQQDLDLLGNKPVKFPYCTKGVTDSVKVLNALVNVRKDSVKFSRVGRVGGGYSSGFYRLEFVFDCDVSCYIQIHFCAKEVIDEHHHQAQIVSRQNHFDSSERYHFPICANQQFSHFVFKPHRYDLKMMHWDGGSYFPVVIEIRSVTDQPEQEQMQMTMCSIERSTDQSAALILKPLKQKLVSNGVVFLLQEIFGIENKENAETVLAEENGAECIICMANPRDTMILPCRHLCICNGCAETLRYKLNNCPICRSPFKALLKIRAMRSSLVGMGSDGNASTMRIRREPLTLFEAINGPFHTPQSGTLPHVTSSKASVLTSRVSNKGNVITTASASSHSCIDSIASNTPKSGSHFQRPQSSSKIVIKKRDPSERIELDIEHIELEELDPKRRKNSHSSSFIQYSPGSNSITRRSSPSPPPSLWRAQSPFSTANSSYQSARSIAQQKGGAEEQEECEDKTKHGLLTSAPNLAVEANLEDECVSSGNDETKLKNVSLDSKQLGRFRQKGQHVKRMSEPPTASSSTSSVKQQRAKSVKTGGSSKAKSKEPGEVQES